MATSLATALLPTTLAFLPTTTSRSSTPSIRLSGWLDNFLPKPIDEKASKRADEERRSKYPEQYPAAYDLLSGDDLLIPGDSQDGTFVRPLLKNTQLESRPVRVAYDASKHGWGARDFHVRVDGLGAAVVLATEKDGAVVGGYNPKGWASTGGARPSVAAFLFYQNEGDGFQKLRKVGGGGLACSSDEPNNGIFFGPDGLVVPLQPGRERLASSKLGTYYERGPEGLSSVLSDGVVELKYLKVLVGVYGNVEEIPYSGAVLDMTSG